MKSVNKVTLLGHIVNDPELKKTKTGKSVSSFALATNNEWYDSDGQLKRTTDFHRIVAWEKLAEICCKHLKKGSPVYMEGRLTNRSYEGKDKVQYFVTEVVAGSLHILKWETEKKAIESVELAA